MTNNEDENVEIGKRLRAAREALGFTQEEASGALGLARTSLIAIEAGTRRVTAVELRRLAKLYRKTVGWLLGEEPPEGAAGADVALFRATSELSADDRDQLLRYAQFLALGSDRAHQ